MSIFNAFDKKTNASAITPESRREKSNQKIKSLGIACFEKLPMLESSEDVNLKSLEQICRRAIASLVSIQLAIDLSHELEFVEITQDGKYVMEDEREEKIMQIIEEIQAVLMRYDVEDDLLNSERKMFDMDTLPTRRELINLVWNYEAYWAILWALNLVEDISYPTEICDCQRAIDEVAKVNSLDEFIAKCELRDIEEILDMLDLHYRYDWACVEKRINPDTPIADLNPEVVNERRKGLEWLVSEEEDWDEISLDT